jgi:hypothetical protein
LVYVKEHGSAAMPGLMPAHKPEEHGSTGIAGDVPEHKTLAMRAAAAAACAAKMKLHIPVLLDTMNDAARSAFGASSGATAIIDLHGNVVFHTTGSTGVQPVEAARVLEPLLRTGSS